MGTLMPARNPVPLDFASIPKHAWYIKKLPLHSPALIFRKAPATKDARVTPPCRYMYTTYSSSTRKVVRSEGGVQQGEPLGPLLFALTLQKPLEKVAEMGLARPVTFADDTFFQGA
jgi:hypothetical protein